MDSILYILIVYTIDYGKGVHSEMHITTTALRDLLVLQIGYMQYIGFISLYDITI